MANIEERIVDITIRDTETKKVTGIIYPTTMAEGVYMNSDKTKTVDAVLHEMEAAATESTKYTNDTPTTAKVGGILAGETFDGITFQELMNRLLYPTEDPICELVSSVDEGVYENGTTKSMQLTANLTVNSEEQTNNFSIHAKTKSGDSELINFGTDTIGEHTLDVSEDTELYAQVDITHVSGMTITVKGASKKYTFVDPVYTGILESADIAAISAAGPESDLDGSIVSKFDKVVTEKANTTLTYSTGSDATDSHMVFFVPSAWGAIKIQDQNRLDITNSFESISTTINGVSGTVMHSGPVLVQGFSITLITS